MRFQSSFILMTVQAFFFASSWSACVNVPTFVSGFVLIAPSFAESMTKFVEVPEQEGRAAVSKLPRVTSLY